MPRWWNLGSFVTFNGLGADLLWCVYRINGGDSLAYNYTGLRKFFDLVDVFGPAVTAFSDSFLILEGFF